MPASRATSRRLRLDTLRCGPIRRSAAASRSSREIAALRPTWPLSSLMSGMAVWVKTGVAKGSAGSYRHSLMHNCIDICACTCILLAMSTAMTAPIRPVRRLARGFARGFADVIAPPQALAFWASRLAPGMDGGRARVLERPRESADTVTLVLQPGRGWGGFEPGQHVSIGAEIDGRRVRRSYSPTGIPRADGRIAITVKRVAGGKLSEYLCDAVAVGAWLDIGPAFGEMTLLAQADGPLLFLAAGSGITPLISMTRAHAARGMPVPLTLLYWARRRDALCFVDELRGLAREHADFNVQFL